MGVDRWLATHIHSFVQSSIYRRHIYVNISQLPSPLHICNGIVYYNIITKLRAIVDPVLGGLGALKFPSNFNTPKIASPGSREV